jgi:hypothetical protein
VVQPFLARWPFLSTKPRVADYGNCAGLNPKSTEYAWSRFFERFDRPKAHQGGGERERVTPFFIVVRPEGSRKAARDRLAGGQQLPQQLCRTAARLLPLLLVVRQLRQWVVSALMLHWRC